MGTECVLNRANEELNKLVLDVLHFRGTEEFWSLPEELRDGIVHYHVDLDELIDKVEKLKEKCHD